MCCACVCTIRLTAQAGSVCACICAACAGKLCVCVLGVHGRRATGASAACVRTPANSSSDMGCLCVKIWERVDSLFSDLQKCPANSAWTVSPTRWPVSSMLAVQIGVLLLIPDPDPRQAHETTHSVCATGKAATHPSLKKDAGKRPSLGVERRGRRMLQNIPAEIFSPH